MLLDQLESMATYNGWGYLLISICLYSIRFQDTDCHSFLPVICSKMISGAISIIHSNMVVSFQDFEKSGLGVIHMEYHIGITTYLLSKFLIIFHIFG